MDGDSEKNVLQKIAEGAKGESGNWDLNRRKQTRWRQKHGGRKMSSDFQNDQTRMTRMGLPILMQMVAQIKMSAVAKRMHE